MEASIAKYRSTTGRYLESDYAVVSAHTPVKMVLVAPSPMDLILTLSKIPQLLVSARQRIIICGASTV